MTLRQISYLLAVAETGSFTAAARRMHVSQPSLSQQIRSLEAELGGPLLERPPKPVKLTTAGRAFLTEARACVTAANRAAESARSAMKLQVGELRVSTVLSLATSQLPSVIRRWQVSHPAIAVHLHADSAPRPGFRIRLGGRIGLGHCATTESLAPGPSIGSAGTQLVVVLPRSDPSSEIEGPMPLNSLAGRDWVLFEARTRATRHRCLGLQGGRLRATRNRLHSPGRSRDQACWCRRWSNSRSRHGTVGRHAAERSTSRSPRGLGDLRLHGRGHVVPPRPVNCSRSFVRKAGNAGEQQARRYSATIRAPRRTGPPQLLIDGWLPSRGSPTRWSPHGSPVVRQWHPRTTGSNRV